MEINKTKKDSANLWTTIALLLLAFLIVTGYKYRDSMRQGISESALLDKSCDLRKGACVTKLPAGGQISFSINPSSIPISRPLALTVKIKDIEVTSVEVDFVGISKDMDYNRSKLEKTDENHFTGKAVIPIYTGSKIDWEARVSLQTDKGVIMAPFRFYTIK